VPDFEVWENAGLSTVAIQKLDVRGNVIMEQIVGGRKVQITPQERRMNQELAAHDNLDVFMNGMLVPVRLVDAQEDNEKLQTNSNAMSESAMKALFKSQLPTFKKKIAEISNSIALERLLTIASEVDGSIRQVEAIQDRLNDVRPHVSEIGSQKIGNALGTKAPEGERRGVTPK
jgi:hypothetical protein